MAGPRYCKPDTLSLHAGQRPDSDFGSRVCAVRGGGADIGSVYLETPISKRAEHDSPPAADIEKDVIAVGFNLPGQVRPVL